jgi:hypothetical protein
MIWLMTGRKLPICVLRIWICVRICDNDHGGSIDFGQITGQTIFFDDFNGTVDVFRNIFTGWLATVTALACIKNHATGDKTVCQHTFRKCGIKEFRNGCTEDDQMRVDDFPVVIGLFAVIISDRKFSHFINPV